MEVRLLVNISSLYLVRGIAIALIVSCLGASSVVHAAEHQRISFYKLNKDDITQALRFTRKKARKAGCQNFIRKARLHKVVQFQYQHCSVYQKKNCAEDSLMQFYRTDEPEIVKTELDEGFGWHPVGDHKRGEKAKSWNCQELELELEQPKQ